MRIYKNVSELIGKTPIMELSNYSKNEELSSNILAKLEFFNPAGSIKDRAAYQMLDDAKKKGLINEDTIIIEPTSGNTGIGLASICAWMGNRIILTMPETMSIERRNLLKAYGAEIVLTDGKKGMSGAVEKARELSKQFKNSFIPSQFENPANPQAHIKTTGPEIWEDTDGKIDILVSCVGTGGTITGIGKYLKSKNPQIKVVAVEPDASPLLSKGVSGSHKIQGIGANFVPDALDKSIYDEIITITDDEAYKAGKDIAKSEGILVGISSGAAVCAAAKILKRPENKDKMVVAILPDTGERYLSTGMYD